MIKFSIIVPCYNSAKFLSTCVKGFQNQKFGKDKYEVIFIDDCSTDDTLNILYRYDKNTDFSYRVIKNKINSGPGFSRYYAATQAKGEYLCFCDSDDWLDPNFLSDINNELDRSGSDIVFFDMTYQMKNKNIRKCSTSYFKYADKLSYLANYTESLCNLVVRCSLFLSVPQIDIRNGEDLALVPLLIFNARKITHIDKIYYHYVMRNDSASLGRIPINAYNNMILAFGHICKNLNVVNDEVQKCIEYIGIRTILYNATFMAIKGGNDNSSLKNIVTDFSKKYPNWWDNKYKCRMGFVKNNYLWFLKNHFWIFCRAFVLLHSFFLKH